MTLTWRLAKSLSVLLAEVNAAAPGRSKAYDGTIGDAAHASRASRHNPNDAGVVCALDITHDPAHAMDTYRLFDRLRADPHPDLEYVISARRIAKRAEGWTVRPYTGANAHDHHIHIAVGRGPDSEPMPPYDDTYPWGIAAPAPPEEEPMPIDVVHDQAAIDAAQQKLIAAGLLTRAHPGSEAASVGLLMILCARLLDQVGLGVDLEQYELRLVKRP